METFTTIATFFILFATPIIIVGCAALYVLYTSGYWDANKVIERANLRAYKRALRKDDITSAEHYRKILEQKR